MLSELCGLESRIDQFLEKANDGKPVLLYGAGFALPAILAKLEKYQFNIAGICDSQPAKQGTLYNDKYKIYSLEEGSETFIDALFVISAPAYFWEIYEELSEKLGESRVSDIDLDCAHYFELYEFRDFFHQHVKRFDAVLDWLEDDGSRETYRKVMQAHLTGERKAFEAAGTGMEDWYLFKSYLKPHADSVYLDCGAYDGDTVELFQHAATEGYQQIYAFEPDPAMQPALEKLVQKDARVTVVEKGAFNKAGTMLFHPNGMYSFLLDTEDAVDDTALKIPVARIDDIVGDVPVDIIKMDIEGAEFDALEGAKHTIQTHKPRLAICLYHRVEDFVRIAERLLEYVPEYKFRIRHQSTGCTDTILFASCEE